MPDPEEPEYYAKRAADHDLAGDKATDVAAIAAHRELATLYEAKRVAENAPPISDTKP